MAANQLKTESEIIDCERKLLNAFTAKDLNTLDELIHDSAFFVLPNGITLTKPMVLDTYRTGNTAMTAIAASDQRIHLIDDTAVVTVTLQLTGTYQEQTISAVFRYIRVWKLIDAQWKAIAVSGVPVGINSK